MNLTRVLVNIGGVVGVALATVTLAQPPATPATTEPTPAAPLVPGLPTPAAPAVPAKAEPTRVMSKEAAELLDKAKAAGKAAKDLTANIETVMSSPGSPATTLKGNITTEFKAGMMPLGNWRIDVAGTPATAATPPTPEAKGKTLAFDGKLVRVIDPAKKEMTETPAANGMGFPEGEEGMLLPMWFMEQRADRLAMMKPVIVEQVIEGEVLGSKVGEEKVTIVRQIRQIKVPGMDDGTGERVLVETSRLSLGADNLPRKAETTMEMKGGEDGQKQQISQTYSNLKINTTPAADVYTLKAPEGFKTRQVTADEGGSPELTVKAGDAAIDFALKDADGKEYKLADFKGKIVLLDFWATWCGPCKQAMPSIQKISEDFKDKPVVVIGVNTWERGATAGPEYIKKQGYTYLNLLKGDDLAKSYGISGIPTMILIDKDGKVLHTAVGFGPGEEDELKKMINEKLGK